MNNWINKILYKYTSGNAVEKIIYINVILFLLTYLFNTLSFLMGIESNFIINWFALSPHIDELIFKPWSIISYGFLHDGFFHILFNLVFLFYFGNMFLDYFNKKQFLLYFILGIISGGFIFILSFNYLPALKTHETYLVGASAGVTAILIGITSLIPHYAINFRFIGSIKLWHIATVLMAIDIIQIPNGNAGGHLAHLGGALLGFLLTTQFNEGKSLIQWMGSSFQIRKEKPLKTVYKKKNSPKEKTENPKNRQKKIDTILDKISKSGYETLTQEEKDFLFKIGKDQ